MLKNNGNKHVVSNHSYWGTCQTKTCLTGHCCSFHSDALILALLVWKEFNGNGTFQEQKEGAKIEGLETNCKIKLLRICKGASKTLKKVTSPELPV